MIQSLLRIARRIDQFNEWVGRICYWLILAMLGLGATNVVLGKIGNIIHQKLTSNVMIEGQWYLFSVVFLLGAAYVLRHSDHVRVDFLYSSWNMRQKAWANLAGTLLFLIPFCIMVIWVSWGPVLNSWTTWELSPDPDGLPRAPVKSLIIFSFLFLMVQGISEAIKNMAILTGDLRPGLPADALSNSSINRAGGLDD